MEVGSRNGTPASALCHAWFPYRSVEDFLAGATEFVLDGLAAAAAVLVALPTHRLDPLRENLQELAGQVNYLDMTTVGRNPARVLPELHAFATGHPERPIRILGEPIWPGRRPAEIIEALRHEALLNLAFDATPIDLLCPYETATLGPDVISAARRTHPVILVDGTYTPNPTYTAPHHDDHNL
jgi:hypothetical protein